MKKIVISVLSLALLVPSIAYASTASAASNTKVTKKASPKVTKAPVKTPAPKPTKVATPVVPKVVTLDSLMTDLKASSEKNFTVSYRTDGEDPGIILVQDNTHFITQDYRYQATTVGKDLYQRFDAIQLIRAKRSTTPALAYYTDIAMSDAKATLDPVLYRIYLVAKYGVITSQNDSQFVVAYDFQKTPLDNPTDRINIGNSMTGTLTYNFDKSTGKLTSVTSVEQETFCDTDCDYARSWNFSYTPVTAVAPAKGTYTTVLGVDALPRATDLEIAAYETAYQAQAFALEANRSLTSNYILEASTVQATPEGLTAQYTPTGLKFILGNDALCIDPGKDKKSALVTVCQPK